LVDWASHVIVVLSEAIVSPNWTWDVLRFVNDKLKQDAPRGSIIALVPQSSTPVAAKAWFAALHREFPWLANALLIEPESPRNTSSFSEVSGPQLTAWRQGNTLRAPERFDPTDPAVAQDFARALQWAAMSFHSQAFEARSAEQAFPDVRSLYRLDRLPQAGQPANFEGADQAQVDFDHMLFQAEYLFDSRVVDYLGGGQDPFVPAWNAAEFERQVAAVIRHHLTVVSPEPNDSSARSDGSSRADVAGALRAFQRFAKDEARNWFVETFGDINQIGRLLFDGISEPERAAWSDTYGRLIGDEAEFAQALWPFSAEVYEWRLRFPASFATSRTFPEYLEALTGLLMYYLRSAAEHSPDAVAECRYEISESAYELMRRAFASSFVSTEQRPLRSSSTQSTNAALRLPNFADLTARLCDAVMWGVRAEAARRLAREPEFGGDVQRSARGGPPTSAAPPVDSGEGTSPGMPTSPPQSDSDATVYDLLSVQQNQDVIEFTLQIQRGREVVRAVSTQVPLIEKVVRAGADDRNYEKAIGRSLSELLIPTEVKPFLASSRAILLQLDGAQRGIPGSCLKLSRALRRRGKTSRRGPFARACCASCGSRRFAPILARGSATTRSW
jgi:hypothetical protein